MITPIPVSDIVFIAGMCFIAGVVRDRFALLPVLLAIAFPYDQARASFVGMVVSVIMGGILSFSKGAR